MAGQNRRQYDRRRSRGRAAATAGVIAVVGVLALGGVGYAAWASHRSHAAAAPHDDQATAAAPTAASDGLTASSAPTPSASGRGPSAAPSTSGSAGARPPHVPARGTGRFSTAPADGEDGSAGRVYGQGRIRRYKVEVEGGIPLSAPAAAHEIAQILGDPRGWTADGHDGFQLVSSGRADFVIKIATPDTTDAICGSAGLLTGGEVNCDVGATVVVNLKRWLLGSPQFPGPIHEYRALIVNHEVGHRIGHGHEGCPGPGRLAPVMMQQIKGLHGCVANAWPYDARGRYVQGPPAP